MTSAQHTIQEYQTAQFSTADRGEVLLLVFDGALKFLTLAERGLRDGDLDGFVHNLGRAQAVITELRRTLNYDAGGTIAVDLGRLYSFCLEHLAEANFQKSPEHVATVRNLINTIADGFRTILADGTPDLTAANAA